tara:strand:- start:2826 stop:4841 length:2016 start_codon:yes stop_codon:yes gene_type:complete
MKLTKKKEQELKGTITRETTDALGYQNGKLVQERSLALDYYNSEPFGNEVEGRSQVISSDVLEAVESVLPSLLRIFTAGDDIVKFEPVGPEDEEASKQATEYINHIIFKENDGWKIFYTWFKDALIQKNGFIKHYYKYEDEFLKESYKGLTEIEYQALLIDDAVEVVNVEEVTEEKMVMTEQGEMADTQTVFNVDVKRKSSSGKICIENVPPEEMLLSKRCKNIADAPFVAHRIKKTVSDLIGEGYDRKKIEDIPSYANSTWNEETLSRNLFDEESYMDENADPSMREILYTECYLRTDIDNDGVAELIKVCTVGDTNEILDVEEISYIPFSTITPIINPHRLFGMSVADLVMDLQQIKSVLLRQLLDNAFLMNNSRVLAVDSQVNLDDLLQSRAGNIVRVKSPNAVVPLQAQNFMQEGLAMMEKVDQIKEQRSGISRMQQGLDPNTIQKSHTTATGVREAMQSAGQRIETIARVFAETGIKDLMNCLLKLTTQYQDYKKVIKIRNNYVPIDPREWKNKFNLTINVGLGTGSHEQRLQILGQILGIQEKIMMSGSKLANEQNIYNTLERMVHNAGFKSPQEFFTNPETLPPEQPKDPMQENPLLIATQQQIQADREKNVAELQLKKEKMEAELELKKQEQVAELELKKQEMIAELQMEREKMNRKAQMGTL